MLTFRAVGEEVGHRGVRGDRADPLGRYVTVEVGAALAERPQHLVLGHRAEELLHRTGHVDHRGLAFPQRLGGDPGAGVDVEHLLGLLHHRRGGEDPGPVDVGDELRHVVVGRVGQDLLGGADLNDPTVPHHRDTVAEPHGLVQVVRDEDDRLAEFGLKLQELVLNLPADQRVQRRERLVHQQDLGSGRERAGQPDSLPHAAGKVVGQVVRPLRQAHHAQRVHGSLTSLGLGQPGNLQRVPGVLQHRPMRHEREVLEHHADLLATQLAQRRRLERGQLDPIDPHASPGGLQQAVEHPDQGRLSGTGEAHDDEDLAGAYLEVRIDHRGRGGQPGERLGARLAVRQASYRFVSPAAENLVQRLHYERGHAPPLDGNRLVYRITGAIFASLRRYQHRSQSAGHIGPAAKPTDALATNPVGSAGLWICTQKSASTGAGLVVRQMLRNPSPTAVSPGRIGTGCADRPAGTPPTSGSPYRGEQFQNLLGLIENCHTTVIFHIQPTPRIVVTSDRAGAGSRDRCAPSPRSPLATHRGVGILDWALPTPLPVS